MQDLDPLLSILILITPILVVVLVVVYPVRSLTLFGAILMLGGGSMFLVSSTVIHEIAAMIMIVGGLGLVGIAAGIDALHKLIEVISKWRHESSA